ncbi:MAG: transposase [Patescibacteria group bacterium]
MKNFQQNTPSLNETTPYHVLSRAIEGRPIFQSKDDCYRFIFQMYITNHGSPASNLHRRDVIKVAQSLLDGEDIPKNFFTKQHSPLVHFLSFTHVVNHYHFLLLPIEENGVSRYMQKLNTAFARYFNIKYARRGPLFESRYKTIAIESESQLDAIIRYINVKNPLDVHQPGWRERGLQNKKEAWDFLFRYPFSSFPDIFGNRNSKLIAQGSIKNQYLERVSLYGKDSYLKFLQADFHSSLSPDISLE